MIILRHPPALRAAAIFRRLTRSLAVGMLTSLCAAPGYWAVSSLFAGKTALSATSVHSNDEWRYSEREQIGAIDAATPPLPQAGSAQPRRDLQPTKETAPVAAQVPTYTLAGQIPAPPPMLAGPIAPGLSDMFATAKPVGFTIAPPPSDRDASVRPVLVGYRPLDEAASR